MMIDCISDLHGFYPQLPGGDLLILAGDYTATEKLTQWANFFSWLKEQPYDHKVLIAGNHDNFFQTGFPKNQKEKEADDLKEVVDFLDTGADFEYLCDSGMEYKGLKIWGSPWTKTFPGMNPHCKAFTCETEEELAEKWKLIPDDVDILITHSPPYGILDKTKRREHVGSESLREHVMNRIKPKLHVFGHIHEWGGRELDCVTTKFVNSSLMNEDYELVNKPVRIEI
jgi:Icc-related predicted phosphoesterase